MIVDELFSLLRLKPDMKSFSAADKMLSGIKGALVGVAAYASFDFFRDLIKQTTDEADKLDELSQSTGINIESLQELGYAASFSGLGVEQMGASLNKLSRNMDAAKRGSKDQVEAFRKVKVEYKNADGTLRSTDEVFGDLADRFAAMPDGAEKTAMSMRFFGKSGAQMIPVLNEGREGLEAMKQEARDLGIVLSQEDAAAMAEFNDSQDRFRATLKGMRLDFVKFVLPTLQKWLTGLREWIKANREIIQSRIRQFLGHLATGIRLVVSGVGMLIDALKFLVGGFKLVIDTIFEAFDAVVMWREIAIAAAIAVGIAWLAAVSPLALMGLAVVAVTLLFEDLWQWIKGGDSVLEDLFYSFVKWIEEGVTGVINAVVDEWRLIFNDFFNWLDEKLGREVTLFNAEMRGEMAAEAEKRGVALPGQGPGAIKAATPGFFDADTWNPTAWFDDEYAIGASAQAGQSYANTMNAQVTVNMGPNGTPQEAAAAVRKEMDVFWDDKMRAGKTGSRSRP